MAESTKKLYAGAFRKWETYRKIQNKDSYISEDPLRLREEDDSLLAFAALQLGPMEKDHATAQTYTTAIERYRKLKRGENPLMGMKRLQLLLKGAKRVKGPQAANFPLPWRTWK